jgi:hypothetical protein
VALRSVSFNGADESSVFASRVGILRSLAANIFSNVENGRQRFLLPFFAFLSPA